MWAVTGESVPVYRGPGETAFAGTLALDGSIILRVTRTGEDSTVGQIIKIDFERWAKVVKQSGATLD